MSVNSLINEWKTEESIAHIHGWDFSHIAGRYLRHHRLALRNGVLNVPFIVPFILYDIPKPNREGYL